MAFRVPTKGGGANGSAKAGWSDESFASFYPSLTEWLGQVVSEDGTDRQSGTVLVFAEQGHIKACLTDRQSGQRAFLAATSWEELLGSIEKALATGEADWRLARPPPKGR